MTDGESFHSYLAIPLATQDAFRRCQPSSGIAASLPPDRQPGRQTDNKDKVHVDGQNYSGIMTSFPCQGVFPRYNDHNSSALTSSGQNRRYVGSSPMMCSAIDNGLIGDDAGVIAIRRSGDAQSLAWKVFRDRGNTMTVAAAIVVADLPLK